MNDVFTAAVLDQSSAVALAKPAAGAIVRPPRPSAPTFLAAARAAFVREWISHRLNRFLYAHLALTLIAGCLPLLSPAEAIARGAPWWILNAVLYAISLSAMLLGLSSAHAEIDEFPLLLTQPAGVGALIAGKFFALAQIVVVSAALLVAPAALAGGGSAALGAIAAGGAGVGLAAAALGFAIGFWIRDPVRGLIAAVGAWLALLFGADLALLAIAGAPWAQRHADLWVAPLMLNPLDAFRVTVLFAVERAAYAGFAGGALATWWIAHAWAWLATLLTGWTLLATAAAWLGANRRREA